MLAFGASDGGSNPPGATITMAKKTEEKEKKIENEKSSEEELIVKLGEKLPPSKIGLILKEKYGIPKTKKKISVVLAQHGISGIPEDLSELLKHTAKLRKHLEKNKDKVARRALNIFEARILKLVKYYKRKHKLPSDWKP